jgi:hypothetical protein
MVYMLNHWHEQFDGAGWPMGDEKHIGFFDTRDDVDAAIARLLPVEGFRDYPDGFRITEVAVDADLWPTGFSLREDHRLIPSGWWSRLRREFALRTRRASH